jgi:hypothetical protein
MTTQVSQDQVNEYIGLDREGVSTVLRSPFSPNAITEGAIDKNGDGKVDEWGVNCWEGTEVALHYILTDTDRDGSPYLFGLDAGNRRYGFALMDDNGDGDPDRFSLGIDNRDKGGKKYNYHDYDMDGKWDQYVCSNGIDKSVDSRVDYRDHWTRVLTAEKYQADGAGVVWVEGDDGSKLRLKLEDGAWIPHEAQVWNDALIRSVPPAE